MLRLDFDDVAHALPAVVRQLHDVPVETVDTAGDGACSIHSVWGEWKNGYLFKDNARSFLREAFGETATHFRDNLKCEKLFVQLEVGLKELLSPILEHPRAMHQKLDVGSDEGRRLWMQLVGNSPNVAQRCFDCVQADIARFSAYKNAKEKVIEDFGAFCVSDFADAFIKPFSIHLGMWENTP